MKHLPIFVFAVGLSAATMTAGLAGRPTLQAGPPQVAAPAPPPARPTPAKTVAPPTAPAAGNEAIRTYCVGCHNEKVKRGELSLASFDVAKSRGSRRRRREGDPEAAHRHDAAARGVAKARRRDPTGTCDVARDHARCRRGRQDQPRAPDVPAAQPRRICGGDQSAGRTRRRRQHLSARRYHQRELRQHRRCADTVGHRDAGLPAGRRLRQWHRGRRSGHRRELDAVSGAANRLAEAPRRGRAVRHAWRHGRRPQLPGRRHLRLPVAAPRRTDRIPVRPDAARGSDGGRARRRTGRAPESRSLDVRIRSAGPDRVNRSDQRQGRPAQGCGDVHSRVRRLRGRSHPADRSHPGRHADRRGLRRHDSSAPAQPGGRRAACRHGGLRPPDAACNLHVPSHHAGGSRAVRPPHSRPARDAGVSATCDRGRRDRADAVLREGRPDRRLRGWRPNGAAGPPVECALPVPDRRDAGAGHARRALSHQRRRSRVAAVVLPLGHVARRGAHHRGAGAAG